MKKWLDRYDDGGSFGEAFSKARNELGPNKTFTWKGNVYNTNYANETEQDDAPNNVVRKPNPYLDVSKYAKPLPINVSKNIQQSFNNSPSLKSQYQQYNSSEALGYGVHNMPANMKGNYVQNKMNDYIDNAIATRKAYENSPAYNKVPYKEWVDAQNKLGRSDEMRVVQPISKYQKVKQVLKNPMSAAQYVINKQPIPDNFANDRNILDYATDVVNPAFYLNAIKKTGQNIFDKNTYKDALGAGAYLASKVVGDVGSDFDEAAANTLERITDATVGLSGANIGLKGIRDIGIASRDAKFITPFKTKALTVEGNTFYNSRDWNKWYENKYPEGARRPLTKNEVNFLNREIKDRGILEMQRSHPLNPLPYLSKRGIVPESYDMGNVVRSYIPNLRQGNTTSKLTMGPGRLHAWDQYLGLPSKNNSYRIHPLSYQDGRGLTYTIPDEYMNQQWSKSQLAETPIKDKILSAPLDRKHISMLDVVRKSGQGYHPDYAENFDWDAFNKEALQTLKENGWTDKQLRKKGLMSGRYFDIRNNDPDYTLNEHSINPNTVYSYDVHHGSAGGVRWQRTPLANGASEWKMVDTWDINPFSRMKKVSDLPIPGGLKSRLSQKTLQKDLPNFVKRLDTGPLLGGKNFDVEVNYRVSPKYNRIQNLYGTRKEGGEAIKNVNQQPDYNFPAWQLADPIRASYHVVNPEDFHGPDIYKYPNHMTFSDESMYSTPEHMGGHWTELKNGKWQFQPSQWNIQNAGGKQNFLNWWNETEGKQGSKIKFKGGGQIHNWREVEVPHTKNQLSGWLDKL